MICDSHTTNRTIRKPREAQMLRDRQRQNRTGRIMGLLQNLEPKWKHRWVTYPTSKYAGESWWIIIIPILSPLKWPGYAIFIYGAMKSGRMWPVCGRPAQLKHGHPKVMAGNNRRGLRIPRGLKATVLLVMGQGIETSTNAATDLMHSLPDSLHPCKIMSRHVESNHTSTACQRARSPRRPSHLKSHPWQQKCVNHQNQHVRAQVEHWT